MGLPELAAGEYLIEAMFKMRPLRSSGFGEVSADWPVIEAFARCTGRISEPWEIETLFEMCEAYQAGLETGANPLAIPPVEQIESAE